jgi:hypothetical protein
MPTRFYGPLSMSLLQWIYSAQEDAERRVLLRLAEGVDAAKMRIVLEARGLREVVELGRNSLLGMITATNLLKILNVSGIFAIVDA